MLYKNINQKKRKISYLVIKSVRFAVWKFQSVEKNRHKSEQHIARLRNEIRGRTNFVTVMLCIICHKTKVIKLDHLAQF